MTGIATKAVYPLLLALLAPGVAHASTIVLTPLIPMGVDGKAQLAVHQLIASELEFQPEVTGVTDLEARPSALDQSCLSNPGCLAAIVGSAGGDKLITGTLASGGGSYALDLILFDNGTRRIVRRQTFNIPQDATSMANAMTGVMRQLLTGDSPDPNPAASADAAAASFELADDDSFAFEPAGSAPAPAPAAAPVDLPDFEDFDAIAAEEDQRRQAEAARIAAEEEARRRAAEQAAAQAAAQQAASQEIDPSMITFGGSVEDISAEEIDSMITFGAPPTTAAATAPAPQPTYAPPPQPQPQPAYAPAPQPAYAPAPQPAPAVADLDEPKPPKRGSSPSRPDRSGGGGSASYGGAEVLQVTARGGYSKYYSFDFLTAGAELAIPVSGGVHLLAGLEAYSVNRQLPVELQALTGQITDWDHIFPMNAGVMYKFLGGMAQPYVGGDVIVAQYYSDEIGADWAGGARLRAGADLMFVDSFGLNVNAAMGFWAGQNWSLIEQGVGNSGVLPQISVGTVFAF